jgi:hypothetical protein
MAHDGVYVTELCLPNRERIGGLDPPRSQLVVVKHADDVLRRSDNLVAAVAAWVAVTPGLNENREARLQMVRSNPHQYSWL